MADVKGFIKYKRKDFKKQNVETRLTHWNEFDLEMPENELKKQAARCMDCGIPFCHSGCPVDNLIPEWNDLVYNGRWEDALNRLLKTNNFPEFTGRVCPAPCENSCVLAITEEPVTIKNVEVKIIEKGFKEGWIKPNPPKVRTGKKVAVIGSGPAGLACADQLNKVGHFVTVFEKNEFAGGLLSLGIPDFKLEKKIVDRRIKLMEEEGIEFVLNTAIGEDIAVDEIKNRYDSIVLCCGAEHARDLSVEGRHLDGIHFAMDFLTNQNRLNKGSTNVNGNYISAKGKKVIVLGGGDTGSDCIGTSNRQGAKSVINYELLSKPPKERSKDNPWPQWAFVERSSTSHEEGCERDYGILTKKFSGENGKLQKLHAVRVKFGVPHPETGRREMKEIPDSEFEIETDLVLLAMGFLGPVKNQLLNDLKIEYDQRGNVKTDESRMTNVPGVFAAGDLRRGQSLVVWAIKEGRIAAKFVNEFLTKEK